MSRFSLRQIRIFVVVAEHENLAAAGRQLGLSRATLSESVGNLEGRLGRSLFDREDRRLRLNADGRAFLRDARALVAQTDAVYDRHSTQSTLTCGASVTVASYILPPVLIALREAEPDLYIDLVVRNTEQIVQMVLDREVQAAVVEGRVANVQLETMAWREDELVFIAPPGHPLTTAASPDTLARARWILRESGSGTRESFDAEVSGWPAVPEVVMTSGCNELIKLAVAAGQGLGCLSRAAVQRELDRGEVALVPYESPGLFRTLSLVCRRDAISNAVFTRLFEALGLSRLQAGPHDVR